MDKYQKAADKTLEQIGHPTAIIVTDVHPYADETMRLAIELAKKTGKPLGLESIVGAEEVAIYSLERGDLTKEEFIEIVNPAGTSGSSLDIKAYLGESRAQLYYLDMADAIESGVKVRALGTAVGMSPVITNAKIANIFEKAAEYDASMLVDFMKFQRQGIREKIDENPKEFFKKYTAEVDKQFQSMSDEDREKFSDRISKFEEIKNTQDWDNEQFLQEIDYRDGIREVFKTLHPLFDAKQELYGKIHALIISPTEKDKNVLESRRKADGIIAEKTAELIVKEGGVVAVYGLGHTNYGNDFDNKLRSKGIDVAIVDPLVPSGKYVDSSFSATDRKNLDKLIAQNMLVAAKESDPNRFTVCLDTGAVTPLGANVVDVQAKCNVPSAKPIAFAP